MYPDSEEQKGGDELYEQYWKGHFQCMRGQMGTIYIFSDALAENTIRCLYDIGPNYLGLFETVDSCHFDKRFRCLFDGSLNYKLYLTYNAKACQHNECIDLSLSLCI